METFKLASRLKLRFATTKGTLSTEQLWDLDLKELDVMAVALEKEYQESGKKSFLVKRSSKDKTTKLKFDIVLDILNTKSEEAEALREASEVKEHNEKIMGIIVEKQEGELKGKSIAELKKLLK